MVFNRKYFAFALLLFVVEVLIALYVKDDFIRPYFGDFLVVMLVYCTVKTFFKFSPLRVAVGTLAFSFLLETLQYLRIVDRLNLQDNVWARTIIGYGFDWFDLIAYTLGILTVLFLEKHQAGENPG